MTRTTLTLALAVLSFALGACSDDAPETDDRPTSPEAFETVLGDPENCAAYDKVKPETEAEVGGWVVAKLTTPYTPAQIEEVVIRVDGRTPCTLTVGGALRVAAGGDTPPENPDFLFFGAIEAGSDGPASVFTMPMPSTYIDQGENLYVYHQLGGALGASNCTSYCQDEDKPDEGWFTPQSEAPHTYETLGSRGLFGSVAVKMSGQSPVVFPED